MRCSLGLASCGSTSAHSGTRVNSSARPSSPAEKQQKALPRLSPWQKYSAYWHQLQCFWQHQVWRFDAASFMSGPQSPAPVLRQQQRAAPPAAAP